MIFGGGGEQKSKRMSGEFMGLDEASAEAIIQLTGDEALRQLSDLTPDQVHQITVALTVGRQVKELTSVEFVVEVGGKRQMFTEEGSEIVLEMVNDFLALRVSVDRKGRKEITDIVGFMNSPFSSMGGGDSGGKKSRGLGKLFGGFKA